jgi:hypothetical protein
MHSVLLLPRAPQSSSLLAQTLHSLQTPPLSNPSCVHPPCCSHSPEVALLRLPWIPSTSSLLSCRAPKRRTAFNSGFKHNPTPASNVTLRNSPHQRKDAAHATSGGPDDGKVKGGDLTSPWPAQSAVSNPPAAAAAAPALSDERPRPLLVQSPSRSSAGVGGKSRTRDPVEESWDRYPALNSACSALN